MEKKLLTKSSILHDKNIQCLQPDKGINENPQVTSHLMMKDWICPPKN